RHFRNIRQTPRSNAGAYALLLNKPAAGLRGDSTPLDFTVDATRIPAPCDLEVVVGLQVQPEFRCGAEKAREPESRIGSDPALAVDDTGHAVDWHVERLGKRVGRHARLVEELHLEDLAGMNRCALSHDFCFLQQAAFLVRNAIQPW